MMIVGGERMMADLEKVLHGLSSCGNDYGIPNICEVTECPYREDKAWCVHELAHDAWMLIAELLKEQVPRLMTLKEVKQWSETHPHKQNPIWIEFQSKRGTDGWRVCLFNSEILTWCKNNEARCWTSQPTDEQRKAVSWNTQK